MNSQKNSRYFTKTQEILPKTQEIFRKTQVFANSELEIVAEKRPKKSLIMRSFICKSDDTSGRSWLLCSWRWLSSGLATWGTPAPLGCPMGSEVSDQGPCAQEQLLAGNTLQILSHFRNKSAKNEV